MKFTRLALAALAVYLLAPASVHAHSGVQSYVYVSVFDDGLEGRVEYPIGDLADVLDIELPDAQSTIDDLSGSDREAIVDYTRNHLDMGDDDGSWDLRFDGTVNYLPTASVGYVLVPFDVVEGFDETPRRWTVTYDGVIEANPERDALFLIEDDWSSATFRNEGEHLLGFSVGSETQVIELESVSATESLREVARRGTVSVDRSAVVLAAVIAVLAGAALADAPRRKDAAAGGSGAPRWRATLTDVAARLGIVIVGQSAALWAIGLASPDVGSRLVMATGALGVLVAAVTWWARGKTVRIASLVVGLLSGVGIGAAFVDQQLHRSAPIRSLVAFDLGAVVTVGFVVVLLLPLMLVVRRSRFAATVGTVLIGVIAIAGLVWLIESSFGLTFRLRTAELYVADTVTSPFIVLAVLALVVLTRGSKHPPESPPIHDGSPTDLSEPVEVR